MESIDPIKQTREVYSKVYETYLENASQPNPDITQALYYFSKNLPAGSKVLDVGCAGGRESRYFSEQGFIVDGCDITPEFLAEAEKNCPDATFTLADMRNLPYNQEEFHALWACASYLHIPKSDALPTLQGFARVLQPSGSLYISVMQGTADGLRNNPAMGWGERYFADYQPGELTGLLHQAGFTVRHHYAVEAEWGPVFLHFFCQKQ